MGAGRSTDWEVTGGSFWCQRCSVLNPDGGFMDPCVSHWAVCLRSVSFKFLLNVYLYFNKISLVFFKYSSAIYLKEWLYNPCLEYYWQLCFGENHRLF